MNGLALYAGYAGLDIGLGLAEPGYKTVCYVEREAGCAANLVARMAAAELHQAPVWDDSATFDGRPWRGKVDIITAGFPCPEVSIAGKRAGIHGDKWLWGDVARIVREVEPQRLLLENVRGILSANDGRAHAQVLGDLAQIGFDVWWGSVPAGRLGASMQRDRIFYVANTNGKQRKGRRSESHSHGRKEPVGYIALRRGILGSAVSESGRGEFQQGKSGGHGRAGPERAGSELGNADNILHPRNLEPGENRSQTAGSESDHAGTWKTSFGQRFRSEPGCASQSLGSADSQRCEKTRSGDRCGTDWYGGGLPTSPPGPNDHEAWFRFIEQFPATPQPAVHGMADGTSCRVDEIRMCGNGVYPLAAAYAWRAGQAALAATTEEGVI